jgi:hypothetical protein
MGSLSNKMTVRSCDKHHKVIVGSGLRVGMLGLQNGRRTEKIPVKRYHRVPNPGISGF